MQKIIFGWMILLVFGVCSAMAQSAEKDKRQDSLEHIKQEQLQYEQDKILEQIRQEQSNQTPIKNTQGTFDQNGFGSQLDMNLLPSDADAWVLRVVRRGGFTGLGLPTVTIKSNSNFACGDGEQLQFQPIDAGRLQPLAQIIQTSDFTGKSASGKKSDDYDFICNDCYVTTITLIRRQADGKVDVYRTKSNKMKSQDFAEDFNSIVQNALGLVNCSN